MTEGNSPRQPESRLNKSLQTAILIVILLVVLIVGYLIVDIILQFSRPVVGIPGIAGTQIQEALHPTPTIVADPVTVIRQIQSLARLETASYTIEKVITAESGEGPLGFLFQDRLLLVAQGHVIAGVDLSLVGDDDIQVSGASVFLTLPASEIFVATLDNDGTYVYDRQTGLFGQQIDLETLARQEAEHAILEAALSDGILDLAQQNAEAVISRLLEAIGFEDVAFLTGTPSPTQNRGGN